MREHRRSRFDLVGRRTVPFTFALTTRDSDQTRFSNGRGVGQRVTYPESSNGYFQTSCTPNTRTDPFVATCLRVKTVD